MPGLGGDRKPATARLEQVLAEKPGEYLLEAVGKDGSGHDVLTSIAFEVSGEAETDWNYRNPYAIDLVADKDSYEPGQTATLLVKTPIAGDALVTVERERVMRSFIVPAHRQRAFRASSDRRDGRAEHFCFRHAAPRRERQPAKAENAGYRIGYANLKVARPKDKLTVAGETGQRFRQTRETQCSWRPR